MQKQRNVPPKKRPRSRRPSGPRKPSAPQPRLMPESKRPKHAGLPNEAQLLEFIHTSEGRIGKREIARAFGIKGSDRIALKQLLKKLEGEGKLARKARKLADPTRLTGVSVLEIEEIDEDGELIAIPVEWDEDQAGKRPRIVMAIRQTTGR